MSFASYEHAGPLTPVIQLSVDARAAFLRRTYAHLLGAVLGFVAIE